MEASVAASEPMASDQAENELVERIAKALYAFENGSTDGWDGPLLQERGREMWRQYARVALVAMRAPKAE